MKNMYTTATKGMTDVRSLAADDHTPTAWATVGIQGISTVRMLQFRGMELMARAENQLLALTLTTQTTQVRFTMALCMEATIVQAC